MYEKILVPLDGSPFAENALPHALGLARHTGAVLHIVLVHHIQLPMEPAWAGPTDDYARSMYESEVLYLQDVRKRLERWSFAKLVMHEYSTVLLDRITRAKKAGWSFFSGPSWFVQGYEEYLGLMLSSPRNRTAVLGKYLARHKGGPGRIDFAFGIGVGGSALAALCCSPPAAALLLGALVGYLALPFDLVPDFIPVAGYLDDALLVALTLRAVLRGTGGELEQHAEGRVDLAALQGTDVVAVQAGGCCRPAR